MQPMGAGAFLQGDLQASAKSVNKLQDRRCLGFEDRFHQQLAGGIENHCSNCCLVHIQLNILGVIHEGAVGLGANDQSLLQRAPFHNALISTRTQTYTLIGVKL
jgi:hypothetical protein